MSGPNIQERLVDVKTGALTLDGYKMLADMDARLVVMEGKIAAIAAIVAPSGGATVDAEARAVISAILAEAG